MGVSACLLTGLLALIIGTCYCGPEAKLNFASYYGDNMVLQKAPQVATIWGYAATASDTLTVSVDGKEVGTTTTRVGPFPGVPVWSFQLPPFPAGGPHTIEVKTSGGHLVRISNVLFGDVWICSGQSNMQFTLPQVFNASVELADAANYPNIRVFTVTMGGSLQPQYDLLSIEEKWSVPSKKTVGNGKWTYFSAVCWLYGKYLSQVLNYPIGLLASSYGGTPVEAWSSPDALSRCPKVEGNTESKPPNPHTDSVLWNAMMHPLVNMTIYGAIWYQGEADAGPPNMSKYSCRFPAMIDDWREKFSAASGQQTQSVFPFGFVQLAAWKSNGSLITVGFPDIRWHQTADYGYVPNERMKNVFMAVAMDLPDFTSPWTGIHPRDKQDVAMRLADEGLNVAYGMTDRMKLRSPYPTDFTVLIDKDATVVIAYDNHKTPLEVRITSGFEVCCIQKATNRSRTAAYCNVQSDEWYSAPVKSSDNTTVSVYYGAACKDPQKPEVGAVRYAWRESPCAFKKCAVYNKLSGYPSPPFVKYIYSR